MDNKEYIPRDDIFRIMKEEANSKALEYGFTLNPVVHAYIYCCSVIRNVPAADVRPVVHGRWIPVDEENDAFDCSECDAMVSRKYNFCPKCGADMRSQVTKESNSCDVEIISDPLLEPCPFCGGKATYNSEVHIEPVIDENGAYVDADTFYFESTGCPACHIYFNNTDDEPEGSTIEMWNKRVHAE